MRITLLFAVTGLLTLPAHATELEISVEIPKLNVAEYHRPYVSVWVEDAGNKAVADLAVWYQMRDTAEGHGTKWLPDLRQWWRKSGRNLDLPVDGVTGPTRPVGRHTIEVDGNRPQLAKLPAGQYTLVVEAAREVGGRELLKIPFNWPAKSPQSGKAQGSSELGAVTLAIRP